jgi:hypothetical protein
MVGIVIGKRISSFSDIPFFLIVSIVCCRREDISRLVKILSFHTNHALNKTKDPSKMPSTRAL